jgi:hypothetical protein
MGSEQSDGQASNSPIAETELVTHIGTILDTALEAEQPKEKNYAIRDALQLLVAVEDQHQDQQIEIEIE